MPDTCYFCNGTEGVGYQKRDKAGVLQDACWPCVAPKQKPIEADLTFLDDAPATTQQTQPKTQQGLFTEEA